MRYGPGPGGEPSDLSASYLAVARSGLTHPGSTLPVLGARELANRPSGLLVPTPTRASRQPVDLIGLVISSDDVGLGTPTLEEIAAELVRCPLGGTVKALVQLLVQLKDPQTLSLPRVPGRHVLSGADVGTVAVVGFGHLIR